MQRIEYKTLDRSNWTSGPWDSEPDKIQWMDEATGLPCLVVRNYGGAWCGYVGVTEDHPLFSKEFSDDRVCDLDVHGGVTFTDICSEDKSGICHVVEPGEPDLVWWLGFDCAHAWDLIPGHRVQGVKETYRDLAYVQDQVVHLAKQLKTIV